MALEPDFSLQPSCAADAPAPSQGFSLLVALIGLVSFALLVALAQQVVLDANQENVRIGGPVYEEGHVSGTRGSGREGGR